MEQEKSSVEPKQDKPNQLKQFGKFLVRHGEKIVAVLVFGIALWIALKGLGYRALPWQPKELADMSVAAEKTIKENNYSLADENLRVFDYAEFAQQIKETIPTAPYRSENSLKPILHPTRLPRGAIEVLAAETIKGEAVRRIDLVAKGTMKEQWKRPTLPETTEGTQNANQRAQQAGNPSPMIWVNVYGTIPFRQQQDIFNQTFSDTVEACQPEYIYYELEKTEIKPKEAAAWQPVVIYPDYPVHLDSDYQTNQNFGVLRDRLVPMGQTLNRRQNVAGQASRNLNNMLLFSDFDVKPARTYAYRIRLYLANPNYNMQESYVEEGVDTKSKYVRSDWSMFARVYVPDRTTVRLLSVAPTDSADFPRQQVPLGTIRGSVLLDYFDTALGQLLPPIEKSLATRGTLCNMTKDETNRSLNKNAVSGGAVNVSYPETGLRSDVCVLDFSGGKKLQKRSSRESQGTPDLFTPGKALLLLPDGTMQMATTGL